MGMSGDDFARSFDIVAETRRRWSLEEKLVIVAEASGPCTNISAVARRHGLKPALLYRWKKELDAQPTSSAPSACSFVPVAIAAQEVDSADRSTPAMTLPQTACDNDKSAGIEIELSNGRRIRADSSVEPQLLKRIIDALEG